MSNSSLATYKLLSPNHSGQRTMPIDRITPHCVVGQLSAAGICGCFTSSSVQASCNYGIGKDGDIGLCVEEKNRSWCTSSNANDQRAVTIECASDRTDPYAFTDKCYNSLINLCVDICKRNGKKKLIWFGDKTKTLNYSPKSDEMILTVHRWFANKACPGDWMYARMSDLANKVTAKLSGNTADTSTSTSSSAKYYRVRKTWSDEKSQLGAYTILQNAKDNCLVGYSVFDESGKAVYTPQPSNNSNSTSGTHTSEFVNLTDEQSAAKLLEVATPIAKEYGVLPSVLAAQCVLESGFCKTELAKKADNILGMKTNLLNSTWTSPTWDGKSSVTILTPEYYNGVKVMVNAPFRKYSCIEDCMKDRCAFFLNAKVSVNAAHPKYYGVTNCKTYKEQITFIEEHGYATDPNYISKVCDIIKRYNLDTNDGSSSTPSTPSQSSTPTPPKTPYRVATSYNGGKYVGQIDAYNVLDNAKKRASEASQSAKKTYYVYDNTGAVVYTAEYKSSSTTSGKITKVSEWISVLKNYGQKMVDVKAVYSNSGNKTDYEVALKQKPVTQNCALYLTHSLAIAGLFTRKDKFYGASDGSLKGSGVTTLTTKIGKIVAEYPKGKMKTDNLTLIPGDIVTYYGQHTNVYIGTENGKKVWYDFGRGTSVKGCTGSTWKSFKRTGEIGGMHVAKVIRLNLLDDVSKTETTTAKPSSSTPKKLYDVKVTITDLRIRETPNGAIKGYIKPGVYGITEEKTVNGIKWGHLLSSVGWIALDYVTRL